MRRDSDTVLYFWLALVIALLLTVLVVAYWSSQLDRIETEPTIESYPLTPGAIGP